MCLAYLECFAGASGDMFPGVAGFEDCRAAAEKNGVALKEAQQAALLAAQNGAAQDS